MSDFTPAVTGSFVALITPMNDDYSVDFEGFATLLDFQREAGTSAVLIMGSSGEVTMLSPEERHAIVRETMKHKTGAMQHWYGCTGPTTEAPIAYVKQAAGEGADEDSGGDVAEHGRLAGHLCGESADQSGHDDDCDISCDSHRGSKYRVLTRIDSTIGQSIVIPPESTVQNCGVNWPESVRCLPYTLIQF